MGEGKTFDLSLTILYKLEHDGAELHNKHIHKIIKISFIPFKDLRIEHEKGEWEIIIKNMFELIYNLNGVFYYTDIQKYSSEKEIGKDLNHHLEYGWSEGHGYDYGKSKIIRS